MQLLKGGFSFRVKRELGSNAEIWQEGFTEHRVKNAEDFERHAVYVRDNPVRARLAENAAAYPYGSAAGAWRLTQYRGAKALDNQWRAIRRTKVRRFHRVANEVR